LQGGAGAGLLVGVSGSGRATVLEELSDFEGAQFLRMAESVKANEGGDPANLDIRLCR
jgi:hypothetical protein